MQSFSKLRKDPIFVLGGMIVLLTIVVGAGFIFLYYKSELDVKQVGNEVGIIRSMLTEQAVLAHGGKMMGSGNGQMMYPLEDGQEEAATIEALPHKAGEVVYASCHDTSNNTVYAWFNMGVDTGAYGYYDANGKQIGSYMHRIPTLSMGTKMDISACAALTREQFSAYIKDQSTLPE